MAKLFSPDWLNELKSRCDVVDVIGRYVPLKKNGREMSGCCPFHHEKTPSFFVYPDSQSYHCFGCKESGDVIKFISKYENVGFVEAVERLANIANMPMPELKDVDQDQIAKKKKERDTILAALREAGLYYHKNLYTSHPQAQLAVKYIQKRQISPEFVRKFGLGCSLDFNGLLNHLRNKGFSDEILKKAGLESVSEKGSTYDSFARRLTFPIIDKDGNVIGFSARMLENKEGAKYKNTSASYIFNKSEVIFAINLIKKERDEARKNNRDFGGLPNIIIVEGQIDVISMHQFGFNNTVACLGTAITPIHARKLRQFTDDIVLLLDGDGAGQKATLRSIDVLRNGGLNVKVGSIPEGKDPDEFLKAYGAERMREIVDSAIDGIEYKIKTVADNFDLTNRMQKTKFVHEALVVIKALENKSEQDIYLELIKKYSGTPLDILREDLNKLPDSELPFWERERETVSDEQAGDTAEKPKEVKKDGFDLADLYIIASLLYNKNYCQQFDATLPELYFTDSGLNEAFGYILDTIAAGNRPSISGLYSYIDVDQSTPLLKEAVNYEFLPDPLPEITFESYLLKNKHRKIKLESEKQQAICSQTTDIEIRNDALRKVIEYTKELNKLKAQTEALSQKYVTNINLMNKNSRR